jgi:hypothetical protein
MCMECTRAACIVLQVARVRTLLGKPVLLEDANAYAHLRGD